MRIAFDGTTLCPGRTGVGYYTEHLLRHLAEQARGDELVVVSNTDVDMALPLPSRVRVVRSRWRAPRLVWMQTLAPRMLGRLAPDVVHFTNGMMPFVRRAPTVVTIHDMSLTLYPRYHPMRRVVLNRPLVNVAAQHADAIITVSESAKRDIVRLYGLSADRVHVVHEAAAPWFGPVTDRARLLAVRERYGLGERFVLYVGTIEPRKNLSSLLDGFAQRRLAGDLPHQLVCAGPYGWLSRDVEQRIERFGVKDAVRVLGYVPFEDLPAIYTLAEMFVFPSLYEGFGLPVVEAMACGAPVLIGPVPALSEIAGDAAEYVDRLDADALGAAIVALARDEDRREELSWRGLQRARVFSWARAARETLAVYRHAMAGTAAAHSVATEYTDAVVSPPAAVPANRHTVEPERPWVS
jgi:glycosyltransferase involved in cell wall biosynthesis